MILIRTSQEMAVTISHIISMSILDVQNVPNLNCCPMRPNRSQFLSTHEFINKKSEQTNKSGSRRYILHSTKWRIIQVSVYRERENRYKINEEKINQRTAAVVTAGTVTSSILTCMTLSSSCGVHI